jgi:hypothetical protein
MNPPELPEGWSYEERGEEVRAYNDQIGGLTFWNRGPDNYQIAAQAAAGLDEAIRLSMIRPRRRYTAPAAVPTPAAAMRSGQLDMFAGLAAPELAEDRHTLCPKHGRFYQPHFWHCKRRRPDRSHKRARQG